MTKPLSFPVAQPQYMLRDWFATQVAVDADFPSVSQATAIMGGPPPNWDDDPLASVEWWAAAEARLRYIHADAMLAARSAAPEGDAPVAGEEPNPAPEPEGFRLREGMYGRRRDGKKVGPFVLSGSKEYPWGTPNSRCTYTDNGHWNITCDSELDIIAEWTDEEPAEATETQEGAR